MTASNAETPYGGRLRGRELAEELMRQKNVQPIDDINDLACDGLFESDGEVDDFIAWVYEQRRSDLS